MKWKACLTHPQGHVSGLAGISKTISISSTLYMLYQATYYSLKFIKHFNNILQYMNDWNAVEIGKYTNEYVSAGSYFVNNLIGLKRAVESIKY